MYVTIRLEGPANPEDVPLETQALLVLSNPDQWTKLDSLQGTVVWAGDPEPATEATKENLAVAYEYQEPIAITLRKEAAESGDAFRDLRVVVYPDKKAICLFYRVHDCGHFQNERLDLNHLGHHYYEDFPGWKTTWRFDLYADQLNRLIPDCRAFLMGAMSKELLVTAYTD